MEGSGSAHCIRAAARAPFTGTLPGGKAGLWPRRPARPALSTFTCCLPVGGPRAAPRCFRPGWPRPLSDNTPRRPYTPGTLAPAPRSSCR